MIAVQDHLPVDGVNIKKYTRLKVAEMAGIKYDGKTYVICYTRSSDVAVFLFDAMQEYALDLPEDVIVWIGDSDTHNPIRITSKTETDKAGVLAQEFSEMLG